MRVPRLLIESELSDGRVLDLPADTLRHAVSVLRLRDGAPCRVFDGAGREHHAVLTVSGRRAGTLGAASARRRSLPGLRRCGP